MFASQLKRRLRQGAKLIVLDPRTTGWCTPPHIQADYHLQLQPGTNVAVINALAHVVVTEGLTKEDYVAERCEVDSYCRWKEFVAEPRNSPEADRRPDRRAGRGRARARRGCMRRPATAPFTTASASPSTARARPR